ncbi:MAG: hypothetical protein EBQ67_05600 [Sphingobacteriia bacterium]|nr:hypothetical protein [Sphingobacteriia bacterium]
MCEDSCANIEVGVDHTGVLSVQLLGYEDGGQQGEAQEDSGCKCFFHGCFVDLEGLKGIGRVGSGNGG